MTARCHFLAPAGIACALLPLVGCGEPEPVRVGFVSGTTGRVGDLGVAGRNGATLAVEQRNAAGGVGGRRVEIVARDDEQNADAARRAVHELTTERVDDIVGPATSSMAIATIPLANDAKVPMISPTVTTNELTGRDNYFFRVISAIAEHATKSARFHGGTMGFRKAVALYDLKNRSYTESWLGDFRTAFEAAGGRMLLAKSFESGSGFSFHDAARELLAAGPDVVAIVANSVDAALFAQQLRKFDPKVSSWLRSGAPRSG